MIGLGVWIIGLKNHKYKAKPIWFGSALKWTDYPNWSEPSPSIWFGLDLPILWINPIPYTLELLTIFCNFLAFCVSKTRMLKMPSFYLSWSSLMCFPYITTNQEGCMILIRHWNCKMLNIFFFFFSGLSNLVWL